MHGAGLNVEQGAWVECQVECEAGSNPGLGRMLVKYRAGSNAGQGWVTPRTGLNARLGKGWGEM